VRHVLVLDPLAAQMPPRPEPEVEAATKTGRQRSAKR